jgi:hypothetical protein
MPSITIGEYADAADRQRRFIRETERDLSSMAPLQLTPQTISIRFAVSSEPADGSGELAMLLDVFSNAEKYKKALKEFGEARSASDAAAKEARKTLDAAQAATADLESREGAVAAQVKGMTAREEAVAAREAKIGTAEDACRAELRRGTAALKAREDVLKPKEEALRRREAAIANGGVQVEADMKAAAELRAEYEQKLAQIRALAK